MIQVWKRKWELSTKGSYYFYLSNLLLCFLNKLEEVFLNLSSTSNCERLKLNLWCFLQLTVRPTSILWLIPTPKRSEVSFSQGLNWPCSKGLLVESKVCPAVPIACKRHPLSLNKRYFRYSGTFDSEPT